MDNLYFFFPPELYALVDLLPHSPLMSKYTNGSAPSANQTSIRNYFVSKARGEIEEGTRGPQETGVDEKEGAHGTGEVPAER